MRACPECDKRLRDPECRHECPHDHMCIGPSIHSVKTMLRRNGKSRRDRELYCVECSEGFYARLDAREDKLVRLAALGRVHPDDHEAIRPILVRLSRELSMPRSS